jgi:hypothetical protein
MNNAAANPRPWYREPWPWALMAGPAIVIVAGVITVAYAVSSYDGLVADDYYKRGLTVNRDLGRIETARQRHVEAELSVGATHAMATLRMDSPHPLPDTVTLRLAHPTRASEDIAVPMRRVGANEYRAPIALLSNQRWKLRLETPDWLLQGEISAGARCASFAHASAGCASIARAGA